MTTNVKFACVLLAAFCLSAALSAFFIMGKSNSAKHLPRAQSPSRFANDVHSGTTPNVRSGNSPLRSNLVLASSLEAKGELSSAESLYKQIIEASDIHEPETRDAIERYAKLLNRLGRKQEALDLLKRLKGNETRPSIDKDKHPARAHIS